MPQLDVQWPSENEDFDARSDGSPGKPAAKRTKSAKVADQPTEQAPAEPEQAESQPDDSQSDPEPQESTQEDRGEQAAPADSAPQEESESQNQNDQNDQPDRDPAVQQEAANLAAEEDAPLPADATVASVSPKVPKTSKLPQANWKVLRIAVEGLLVVAVVLLGVYSWSLYNDRKNLQSQVDSLNSNPQSAVQKQTQQLITRVSKLITLPTGETPTVAEVSDAGQAKQQSSFFNNAQNGDRVLMYVKAGEAILYRPGTNKIILVAPLVFTNNGSSSTAGTTSNTSSSTGTTNSTNKTSTSSH